MRNMVTSVTSRLCEGMRRCVTGLGTGRPEGRGLHCESVPVGISVQTASEQSLTWDVVDRFHKSGRSLSQCC